MARQTFTWFPVFESEESVEASTSVVKFGEGYEQRQSAGLNNIKPEWSLVFEGTREEIAEIVAFIKARNGVESFYWRTPSLEDVVVVCSKYTRKNMQGYAQLSVTFRRVFEQ